MRAVSTSFALPHCGEGTRKGSGSVRQFHASSPRAGFIRFSSCLLLRFICFSLELFTIRLRSRFHGPAGAGGLGPKRREERYSRERHSPMRTALFNRAAGTRLLASAMVVILSTLGSEAARAQPALEFTVPAINAGASISYAGGSSDLVATGISISQVEGINTALDNLVIQAISGGVLHFTSGAFTSSVGTSEWIFGAGGSGSMTITGGISGLGLANGSTLLTGQIESVDVIASGSTFKVAISTFVDTVNSTLASAYGVPGGDTAWSGNLNFGFVATGLAPGPFSSSAVTSGNVVTSPVLASEPSSLMTVGLGALAMIGFGLGRRKLSAV
jgi:hypothetical protein